MDFDMKFSLGITAVVFFFLIAYGVIAIVA
ncbi:cytochrome bd-I oxidase subunit CydH [Vibrio salinus]|nr:YnhF family membrane protein [Vibrio salinus]MCE0494635.1 YnhF family membrane protein [Vibrio salinus]